MFTDEIIWHDVITKYSVNNLSQDMLNDPSETMFVLGDVYKEQALEYYGYLRSELLKSKELISNAEKSLIIALESRVKAEQDKKSADQKLKDEQEKDKGKAPELKLDDKIREQLGNRGWTEQDVRDTVSKGAKGSAEDKCSPKKTPPDFLGRNDPASVYGEFGKYIVVNDRTGEVVQFSDKSDPEWVDDSRINWGDKNE
ncbi:colicin [Pectobacterium atrosepticum SCRI1043]|uniref:Colicin n=1 Tax=Pectobacterium atrosepticum (strain SCRI 1043 / ATCC BAA-672) TaxID=218491 RepID=Q6D5P5_PECAS|nr:colicin E5-related ribonuclease [Pectobacterium atrosepticum]GKV83904.1 hypothetical protein PEC301296_02160 [Pectobacterium carotovorum subsp. carotovorum]AIA70831.1 hypothetical protein EV46_09605 [Pectobacterium atrosepticum]AIK14396.1 colicin [Pectobacterium atrosepticum]KFX17919.1 hypothetical protein JV34_02565 [Pectobacterium atrosepticum]KFX25914.1 hypothetical protein KP24_04340 [Pectobacterium atrosepticum]